MGLIEWIKRLKTRHNRWNLDKVLAANYGPKLEKAIYEFLLEHWEPYIEKYNIKVRRGLTLTLGESEVEFYKPWNSEEDELWELYTDKPKPHFKLDLKSLARNFIRNVYHSERWKEFAYFLKKGGNPYEAIKKFNFPELGFDYDIHYREPGKRPLNLEYETEIFKKFAKRLYDWERDAHRSIKDEKILKKVAKIREKDVTEAEYGWEKRKEKPSRLDDDEIHGWPIEVWPHVEKAWREKTEKKERNPAKNLILILLTIFFSSFLLFLLKQLIQNPSKTGYFVYQSSLVHIFIIALFVAILGFIGIYFYVKSSELQFS